MTDTAQKGEREEALELPDDLRIPLHSLQADAGYLIGRVAADGSMASLVLQSLESRLSQVAEAAYRLNGRLLSSSKAEGEMLKRAKESLDIRLNDRLCEMKEGYDDSIVGFNEAWDVVRAFFDERLAAPRPSQLPLKDTTNE